ncbi:zinc transporter ZIP13 homolog [Euwallacea similis]|uniref:zinc transporter ZIP13 homolog n=1 Tax=Euwallacea similis TaxID=1736056 RepID=UPI00344DD8A4
MLTSSVFCVSDVTNATKLNFPSQEFLLPKMPEIPDWYFDGIPDMPWLYALIGSSLVGLTGIVPLVLSQTFNIQLNEADEFSRSKLNSLLGFAVGALLGDVFLHSLPEIYGSGNSTAKGQMASGIYVLLGLITFIIIEKVLGMVEKDGKTMAAYLNLIANAIDNFAHGLSLGGAFLTSTRIGITTTIAVLGHEIPHEFADFGVLLKGGFSWRNAAVMQLSTAAFGILGSFSALLFSGAANTIEARTSWILPFSAGSFLHIALVTILPDLIKESSPRESCKQMFSILTGIFLVHILDGIIAH